MAKIIKTIAQEKALQDVQTDLKSLKNINEVLTAMENIKSEKIMFSTNVVVEGKKSRKHFGLDRKTVCEVLLRQRKKLAKDIENSANQYNICLEDVEQELIDLAAK